MKVKVLEALGHGKLVISTVKGIEGTTFRNQKELLTAESTEDVVMKIFERTLLGKLLLISLNRN